MFFISISSFAYTKDASAFDYNASYSSSESIADSIQDKTVIESIDSVGAKVRESLFDSPSRVLTNSHFTWGADLGTSIDLGGHDMSTFDLDVNLGYKSSLIRFLGVGVGIHRSFGNGNMFIPFYVMFRSSFRTKPSLFFLNLRAGYSFNTVENSPTYGDISASIGVGINLAMTSRIQSHIILSWGFRHFRERHRELFALDTQNINLAQLSFGVNF
ncbi:MAG: hypothetical protein NC328_04420 [Muribaculum sp.]|nr:hypothetical protein [Muribaculum sp.]